MRLTGLDLVRLRVAVPRGAALEDVADVDMTPVEADVRQELLEQLARLPHERDPLLVLVEAWSLADEHQLRVGVSRAEDDLGPPLGEPAPRTGRDGVLERGEPLRAARIVEGDRDRHGRESTSSGGRD
jgi:hypothetical protein